MIDRRGFKICVDQVLGQNVAHRVLHHVSQMRSTRVDLGAHLADESSRQQVACHVRDEMPTMAWIASQWQENLAGHEEP